MQSSTLRKTESAPVPRASGNAVHQLEEVFTAFNKMSSELAARYGQLESRVAVLSRELAAARSAKMRELAEKERIASRLSALMEALPGGVIVLDENGRIKDENPAALRILGRSFKGRTWEYALSRIARRDEAPAKTGRSENGGLPSEALAKEGEFPLKDGRWISIVTGAIDPLEEQIILLTDVSENHRLNDKVNRDKRLAALGEMASRLAHQVRTPLSSAMLYLSHLPSYAKATEGEPSAASTQEGQPSEALAKEGARAAETIGKIQDRLRRIEGLVDGMLRFIRGGASPREPFSLNALVREVDESMRSQAEAAGARLRLDLPRLECVIHGDKEALFNALTNLVVNALQATWGNQPHVSLRLDDLNGHYRLSVQDNGPGIEESLREAIFDPFFSTRPNGTGLGLAVVASAAKAHGGSVHVERAAGGGSVFHLRLPPDHSDSGRDSGLWGGQGSE